MSALNCILQQTLPFRMFGYVLPAVEFDRATVYIYFVLLSFHFFISSVGTTCSQYTALAQTQNTP